MQHTMSRLISSINGHSNSVQYNYQQCVKHMHKPYIYCIILKLLTAIYDHHKCFPLRSILGFTVLFCDMQVVILLFLYQIEDTAIDCEQRRISHGILPQNYSRVYCLISFAPVMKCLGIPSLRQVYITSLNAAGM